DRRDHPGTDKAAGPQTQAQHWDGYQIDEEVRQHDPRAGHWLSEQQFHRAAVNLAGDGARGSSDGPDTQDDLGGGMGVADRQHGHGIIEWEAVAADDGADDLARPLEDDRLDVLVL